MEKQKVGWLECCHPIFQVTQVLERKKLYFIKQTKANFYNFLFNANKYKVRRGLEEARTKVGQEKKINGEKPGESRRKKGVCVLCEGEKKSSQFAALGEIIYIYFCIYRALISV